jgi:hypothetical protein
MVDATDIHYYLEGSVRQVSQALINMKAPLLILQQRVRTQGLALPKSLDSAFFVLDPFTSDQVPAHVFSAAQLLSPYHNVTSHIAYHSSVPLSTRSGYLDDIEQRLQKAKISYFMAFSRPYEKASLLNAWDAKTDLKVTLEVPDLAVLC